MAQKQKLDINQEETESGNINDPYIQVLLYTLTFQFVIAHAINLSVDDG